MFLWVVLSLKHRVDELKRLIFRLRLWLLMAPARKDIFYLTGLNFLWRTVSKQCGFGQRIHWFIWGRYFMYGDMYCTHMADGRPISEYKKDGVIQKYK